MQEPCMIHKRIRVFHRHNKPEIVGHVGFQSRLLPIRRGGWSGVERFEFSIVLIWRHDNAKLNLDPQDSRSRLGVMPVVTLVSSYWCSSLSIVRWMYIIMIIQTWMKLITRSLCNNVYTLVTTSIMDFFPIVRRALRSTRTCRYWSGQVTPLFF